MGEGGAAPPKKDDTTDSTKKSAKATHGRNRAHRRGGVHAREFKKRQRSGSSKEQQEDGRRPRREKNNINDSNDTSLIVNPNPYKSIESNKASKLYHPFPADYNDHFETSVVALTDLFPFLRELRTLTRPSCPEAFTLYDPYYCTGAIQRLWQGPPFHIQRVIHENRDFYADIEAGAAPPAKPDGTPQSYDVCVTNPPYSSDHIERFLKLFAIPSGKPWAMLVPDYVCGKQWYLDIVKQRFTPSVTGGSASFPMVVPLLPLPTTTTEKVPIVGVEPFYLVPRKWYNFNHPVVAGRDSSHFRSLWVVWGGRRSAEILRSLRCTSNNNKDVAVVGGLEELARRHHIADGVRKNPRQRAKGKR